MINLNSNLIEKDLKEGFRAISETLKEGIMPSYIHNDPKVFEVEVEKIFKKTYDTR